MRAGGGGGRPGGSGRSSGSHPAPRRCRCRTWSPSPSGGRVPQDGPVDVDLLVVGGGPVGLATAIEGALAGLSVAVLDRRTGPIDKACGEGLMPSARAALDRLGVGVEGREFRGIHYRAPGRSATALFAGRAGLGVRRLALSAALASRADELGVKRLDLPVTAPVLDREGVEV